MPHKVQKAYGSATNIYDNLITHATPWSQLYMKAFWGGVDDVKIAKKLLSYIPNDFTGTLLDVPVGTAVFTHKKWENLTNATILCLDYSEDMLKIARERLATYPHIACVQGDVGALPVEDGSCDIVLSMNGMHAFPDKPKAYGELYRALKPGGMLIASFYVKGQSKVTDGLVNQFLARKGWFTPPFQTLEDVKATLELYYHSIDLDIEGSIVYFRCVKG